MDRTWQSGTLPARGWSWRFSALPWLLHIWEGYLCWCIDYIDGELVPLESTCIW
jgi:hypothetical protein